MANLEAGDYATVLELIVLADRYQTTRLLTFDERHFRVAAPLGGGSFTLLPAMSPAPPSVRG